MSATDSGVQQGSRIPHADRGQDDDDDEYYEEEPEGEVSGEAVPLDPHLTLLKFLIAAANTVNYTKADHVTLLAFLKDYHPETLPERLRIVEKGIHDRLHKTMFNDPNDFVRWVQTLQNSVLANQAPMFNDRHGSMTMIQSMAIIAHQRLGEVSGNDMSASTATSVYFSQCTAAAVLNSIIHAQVEVSRASLMSQTLIGRASRSGTPVTLVHENQAVGRPSFNAILATNKCLTGVIGAWILNPVMTYHIKRLMQPILSISDWQRDDLLAFCCDDGLVEVLNYGVAPDVHLFVAKVDIVSLSFWLPTESMCGDHAVLKQLRQRQSVSFVSEDSGERIR